MVNTSETPPNDVYKIYEFSQGDTPETGSVPYGVRLNGGKNWEQVPPVIKGAKSYLEDQLVYREVRPEPCVFGLFLSDNNSENQAGWYALVAVAHLDRDRFGRPLTVFRYFWCETEPEDWQCLQAILVWFAKHKQIRWNLQDQLHLQPLSFYQVRKPVQALPNPTRLRSYLLEPNYGQNLNPWAVLQRLNRDVLETYLALTEENPEGSYPVAWAWNVADLKDVKDFFIKPADEVAYQKFKSRVPIMVQSETDRVPKDDKQPKASVGTSPTITPQLHATPSTNNLPRPSTSTMSFKDALCIIADKFSVNLNDHTLKELRRASEALASGLQQYSQEQLPQAFSNLEYNRTLWEDAKNKKVKLDSKFGSLFLWTLLLPEKTIDDTSNIDHLLELLIKNPNTQNTFIKFLRAIRKAFTHEKNYSPSPKLHLSLQDLTCFFFGALFVAYTKDSNSQETRNLQELFKNLLKERSCCDFLGTALNYCTAVASTETFKSKSKDWQDFETTLRRHIECYHEIRNRHQETYQKLIDQSPHNQQWYQNQCYQQWPKVYRAERQSSFFWTPLFKNSGILTALENYNKTVRKEEECWAQRWQALVDHLDQGDSTIKHWPKDKVLPGRLVFVQQQPYVAGLVDQTKYRFNQTIRQVTGFGNGSQPIEQQRSQPIPPPKPVSRERSDQQDDQRQNKWWRGPLPPHVYGVIMGAIVVTGVVGAISSYVSYIIFSPKQPTLDKAFAESVLTRINNSLGFSPSDDPTIIESKDLASALSQTLEKNQQKQALINAENGVLTIGSNPKALIRRLENYNQQMGILQSNSQITEIADSLLCITLDRLIREKSSSIISPDPSKPITPGTLDKEIPACNDERLFIDRQMYIAADRFLFGEILIWTQEAAERENITDAQGKLVDYLKSLNFELDENDENIEFEPSDAAKKRQLLKAFYISAQENGALDISERLIGLYRSQMTVGSLTTTRDFLCDFSNVQGLNLSNCLASAGDPTAGSSSTPVPTTVATTQPEDIYAGVPDDVKSFVDRYSYDWNLPEEEVLDDLRLRLGFGVNERIPKNAWKDKIMLFQREIKVPNNELNGEIKPGSPTDANLAIELFGAVTPDKDN